MSDESYLLASSARTRLWVERAGTAVRLMRSQGEGEDEEVAVLDRDTLRHLLAWADPEDNVTVSFSGPMAELVRRSARDLAQSEQVFVWNAVKLYIEVGSEG